LQRAQAGRRFLEGIVATGDDQDEMVDIGGRCAETGPWERRGNGYGYGPTPKDLD
jgi:hypothetical protein